MDQVLQQQLIYILGGFVTLFCVVVVLAAIICCQACKRRHQELPNQPVRRRPSASDDVTSRAHPTAGPTTYRYDTVPLDLQARTEEGLTNLYTEETFCKATDATSRIEEERACPSFSTLHRDGGSRRVHHQHHQRHSPDRRPKKSILTSGNLGLSRSDRDIYYSANASGTLDKKVKRVIFESDRTNL